MPREPTTHFKKTDWEALAKNLQAALEKEIEVSDLLERELNAAVEALYAHKLAIRYLKERNGNDPV
jgi:hypothetical protein